MADKVFVLHSDLQSKLNDYRTRRAFNPKAWIATKVEKFNDYMRENGLSAAVVSVSGGVDSAVTLGLIKRSLDTPNSPVKRILGVAQPIHSSAWALNRAKEAAESLHAPLAVVEQTNLHTTLSALVDTSVGINGGSFAKGQLRSYMRAPVGYYVAQLLSQEGTPCVVMGTGNMDEDGYLCYFCKAGDGVVDIQLIADLHKSEVFKVAAELGIPQSILVAPPSADLWDGQTDENELGFSYDFVELLTGAYLTLTEPERSKFKESLSHAALTQFETAAKTAESIHRRNKHKLLGPININVMSTSKL